MQHSCAAYLPWVSSSFVVAWALCCGTTHTVQVGFPLQCTPGLECPPQRLPGTAGAGWYATRSLNLETDCCCSLRKFTKTLHHMLKDKLKQRQRSKRKKNLQRWSSELEPTWRKQISLHGLSCRYSDPGGWGLKGKEPVLRNFLIPPKSIRQKKKKINMHKSS